MDNFDIRRFDQYREDNRLEVKKASGGLPIVFGRLILPWQIAMEALLFSVSLKTMTAVLYDRT